MKKFSSIPGIAVSVAVHALALGAFLLMAQEDEAVSPSAADPILLMLGGEDPNKDAGLVGRERGVARGTQDGNLFDPGEFSREQLDALKQQNERLAAEEAAQAERERRAAEAAAKKAAEEKAARERAKREQAKSNPKPAPGKPSSERKSSGGSTEKKSDAKKVSISEILKTRNSGGGNATPSKGGNFGKRITNVRVGNGKPFGTASGTGGNGGDGGKRVANEQMLYVEAVNARFKIHFENVVAQNPPSIPQSVSVDVRFSVGKNGEIRFLEIEGSDNAQIRECIRKTFKLAFPSRFQRPPNGESFTGRLNNVRFLAQ